MGLHIWNGDPHRAERDACSVPAHPAPGGRVAEHQSQRGPLVRAVAQDTRSQRRNRELALERHAPAVGDVRRTRADVSKAEAELGWAPTTSLADGLRSQWSWVAGRVAAP